LQYYMPTLLAAKPPNAIKTKRFRPQRARTSG
jgi:hypothetical protein